MFAAKPIADGRLTTSLEEVYRRRTIEQIYASAATKEERNIEMDKLMTLSDHNYQQFKAEFYAGNAKFQYSFDLIALGLSTAGAFASSGAAPILSGASAAVQGAQGKFNSRFYLEKTTDSLINAMDTIRANKKQIILENMANKDIRDYPIQAGVRDVLEYHYGGSLISALVKIAAETGSAKETAERNLQETEENLARRASFFRSDAGDTIASFWMPDGKTPNPENQATLRKWMDENGLRGVPIITMARGSVQGIDLESKRQKVIGDLKIPANQ